MTKERFGTLPDGRTVDAYTLTNARGLRVQAITYGGIITSIRVPDRNGHLGDVVLGYDSLAGYLKASPYFGAIVGRYANRIANARFTLDGKTYHVPANDGKNSLHGGAVGFDKVLWDAQPFQAAGAVGVVLTHASPAGDQGYPGTLTAHVTYRLTDSDELEVEYEATTDAATPVNLTQHSYFNLAGEGSGDILGERLTIYADSFTPIDSTLIPTGKLAGVNGTPFDFRSSTPIGARINAHDEQLARGRGYDHNFVLNGSPNLDHLAHAASVLDSLSGRTLDVYTSEPGLQFYSGNFLDGTITGKSGHVYGHRAAFCLETQHFPDSPNQRAFPSTILRPGGTYHSRTVFRFGVRE
ncbi:MAG TPA: aldose epimerase family protein [Gemmatimonadales bacterium]|nr:aldose epimerase family protein [Gemmatimonadales bacterium]